MTDPYYDTLIATALEIPGLWLASDQGSYGIRFDSSRPLRLVVPELVERLQAEQPWRIIPAETAFRNDHAAITVLDEVDRSCNVYVYLRAEPRSPDLPGVPART
jgi:hypothetical protein